MSITSFDLAKLRKLSKISAHSWIFVTVGALHRLNVSNNVERYLVCLPSENCRCSVKAEHNSCQSVPVLSLSVDKQTDRRRTRTVVVSPDAGLAVVALPDEADVNHQARRHVIGCPRCGDVTGLLVRSAFCCWIPWRHRLLRVYVGPDAYLHWSRRQCRTSVHYFIIIYLLHRSSKTAPEQKGTHTIY